MEDNGPDFASHRSFLNTYYGWSRSIYDVTRKYYLFGRDTLLKQLAGESFVGLVEIGPGTGRNLAELLRRKPDAIVGGVEASDAMLETCKKRVPNAPVVQGFAETTAYADLLDVPVDRVMFSYCLSMVQDQGAALDNALDQLAPGGQVVVVDFADLEGLPGPMAAGLRTWLDWFHVTPLDTTPLDERGAVITYGPMRYFLIARITKA